MQKSELWTNPILIQKVQKYQSPTRDYDKIPKHLSYTAELTEKTLAKAQFTLMTALLPDTKRQMNVVKLSELTLKNCQSSKFETMEMSDWVVKGLIWGWKAESFNRDLGSNCPPSLSMVSGWWIQGSVHASMCMCTCLCVWVCMHVSVCMVNSSQSVYEKRNAAPVYYWSQEKNTAQAKYYENPQLQTGRLSNIILLQLTWSTHRKRRRRKKVEQSQQKRAYCAYKARKGKRRVMVLLWWAVRRRVEKSVGGLPGRHHRTCPESCCHGFCSGSSLGARGSAPTPSSGRRSHPCWRIRNCGYFCWWQSKNVISEQKSKTA